MKDTLGIPFRLTRPKGHEYIEIAKNVSMPTFIIEIMSNCSQIQHCVDKLAWECIEELLEDSGKFVIYEQILTATARIYMQMTGLIIYMYRHHATDKVNFVLENVDVSASESEDSFERIRMIGTTASQIVTRARAFYEASRDKDTTEVFSNGRHLDLFEALARSVYKLYWCLSKVVDTTANACGRENFTRDTISNELYRLVNELIDRRSDDLITDCALDYFIKDIVAIHADE